MTSSDSTARRPRPRRMIFAAAMGLVLGCAAFIPDAMTEQAAPYVTPLVSSGFAWGVIALIVGSRFKRPQSAGLAGAGVLVLATITYYVLILVVSRRWEVSTSESVAAEGTTYHGLWSVARGTALWLAGSACGGAIMGVLGSLTHHARRHLGSAAWGLATGFLAGEGLFTLIRVRSIWIPPLTPFDLSKLVPSTAQLMLTAITMAVLLRRRSSVHGPVLFVALIVSLAMNVLLWYGVEIARIVLY